MELPLLISACVFAALGAGTALILLLRKRPVERADLDRLADTFQGEMVRLQQQFSDSRSSTQASLAQTRSELAQNFHLSVQPLVESINTTSQLQVAQLQALISQIEALRTSMVFGLDKARDSIDSRLTAMQTDNSKQLEEMRSTVGEKLQSTLETRLGESFRQVSDRLEQVHRGLGEMQRLASDVGGLQRALTNVKVRGSWGEVQLGALLDQILSPHQYERNVRPSEGSGVVVEFAIKLPGHMEEGGSPVLLPIDSKFPIEDYQRLLEAQEKADPAAAEAAADMLAQRIKTSAKDIAEKYIHPPGTTDFAVLFLPTEGLFSEVIRRVGLIDQIQRDYRVVVAGPATFAAFLNSLQMGFATLAIQRRSSEVWKLLGAVKAEFGKFGTVLEGVKKKLDQASSTMDEAARRSRAIERKLKNVQSLQPYETQALLDFPETDEEE